MYVKNICKVSIALYISTLYILCTKVSPISSLHQKAKVVKFDCLPLFITSTGLFVMFHFQSLQSMILSTCSTYSFCDVRVHAKKSTLYVLATIVKRATCTCTFKKPKRSTCTIGFSSAYISEYLPTLYIKCKSQKT